MPRRLYCPRQRGRVVVSLAVAVAMALLNGCGQPGAPGTGNASCNLASQWQVPADNVSLDDLAMVALNEGWAVGALGAQWPPPRRARALPA